MSGQE